MKSGQEFTDNILDTEGGMFQMEITNVIGEAEGLVDISKVSDEIKEKCKAILRGLVKTAELEKDKLDPYILCIGSILELFDLLDKKDDEEKQLFESLKSIILKARDSVKGWKN